MTEASDPTEDPPAVVGVPPETRDAVRPSTTGLAADSSADEDEAAIEAGGQVAGETAKGAPEIEGPNSK